MPWTSALPGPAAPACTFSFRTTCGRQIRVGHLVLGAGRYPARRVSLDIGASPGAGNSTWAGLTAGEARRLAAALRMQAAACDSRPTLS